VSTFAQFSKLAKSHGCEARDCGGGHWQVRGIVTVNWWPESKRRSIFVCGTSEAVASGGPEAVIDIAKNGPPMYRLESRMNQTAARRERKRMLKKDPHCHWCGCPLDAQTATLEHVIPLVRGGTNRRENLVIACSPCNGARGSNVGRPCIDIAAPPAKGDGAK
jgi:hypothetical protein